MKARRTVLAFLLYVSLDLGSPFIPGAFSFDPDECVEGVGCPRSALDRADATAPMSRSPVVRLAPSASPARAVGRSAQPVLAWLVDVREGTRASGDPPSPVDDH
jgi:hypothetical protein